MIRGWGYTPCPEYRSITCDLLAFGVWGRAPALNPLRALCLSAPLREIFPPHAKSSHNNVVAWHNAQGETLVEPIFKPSEFHHEAAALFAAICRRTRTIFGIIQAMKKDHKCNLLQCCV